MSGVCELLKVGPEDFQLLGVEQLNSCQVALFPERLDLLRRQFEWLAAFIRVEQLADWLVVLGKVLGHVDFRNS